MMLSCENDASSDQKVFTERETDDSAHEYMKFFSLCEDRNDSGIDKNGQFSGNNLFYLFIYWQSICIFNITSQLDNKAQTNEH